MGLRVVVRASVSLLFMACSYDFTVGAGPPTDGGAADGASDAMTGLDTSFFFDASFDTSAIPQTVLCTSNSTCQCESGSCDLLCQDSIGCDTTCAASTSCDLSCALGACSQKCEANATCNINCPEGSCRIDCAAGATCTGTCTGGGCTTNCAAGAHCSLFCGSDPSCACFGDGCPK